ncbi:hypothetical protein JW979_02055 [bacterium]|nr:hypothetical protein [candidate division CSSED10-310 bacterium]
MTIVKRESPVIFNSFIIFFMLFIPLSGYAYVYGKPTIAVLDFESIGAEEHLGKAVSEIMRTELIDTNRYRVVERAQINKTISEQRFQKSGLIDDKSAIELGKLLGADLIVIGSVVKIGTSYTINSRMIETKTGEAKLGKNVTGSDLNLLTALSRSLLDSLFGTIRKDTKNEPGESKKGKTNKGLRILKAIYGAGNAQVDVTENLQQKISNGQLAINVNNEIMGHDPIKGVWKALIVRYETDQGEFCAYADEYKNFFIPNPFDNRITSRSSNLTILEAWYGKGTNQVDVKSIVQNRIMDGAVFVRASNQYFGVDPIIGVRKTFFVRYRIQEGSFEASSEEEQDMVIPDLHHKKYR